MKICLISTWPPMQCGIADFTYEIVKYTPRNAEVHIVTYKAKGNYNRLITLDLGNNEVDVLRILSKKKPISNFIYLIKTLKKLKPDIIHLHISYYLFPKSVLLAVILYAIFYVCKLVLTLHDVIPKRNFIIFRYLITYCLIYIAKICVVHSFYAANELKRYYRLSNKRIKIIPHGIYLPLQSPEEPSTSLSSVISKRYILFIGFIRKNKGLEYLIEAFNKITEKHHNIFLVIAGSIQEPTANKDTRTYIYEKKYNEKLKKLSIANNHIIWINHFLSKCEMHYLLKNAEIIVLPYIDCTQSGIFYRALGYCKPIIATCVGNFPEILKNGENGLLIPPKNSKKLYEAIDILLSNKNLTEKFENTIRTEGLPTLKETASSYYQIYKEVLKW